MGNQSTDDDACFREETKGNVRVRLHETEGENGKRYVVEVSAYSSFACQWKILQLAGSFDLQTANDVFAGLTRRIRGYSWMDDEYLLDGDQ